MRTIFIGNRRLALQALLLSPHIELSGVVSVDLHDLPALPAATELLSVSTSGRSEALSFLFSRDFYLLVSAGCPWRLPIEAFSDGKVFINCHPSALPLGRGRHPITEALIAEHRTAGVAVHHMDSGVDTGRIISAQTFPVTDDLDAAILYPILFGLEADVLTTALECLVAGGESAVGFEQKGLTTTYTRPAEQPVFDAAVSLVETVVKNARAWMLHGGILVLANRRSFLVRRASRLASPFVVDRLSTYSPGSICLESPGALVIRMGDGMIRIDEFREVDA